MRKVLERSASPGPKRILSLDGGGIRGCLSLGYLQRIESLVRQQLKDDKAVLSDYFDLVGGTSTGALIAAQLALGFEVAEITKNYQVLGPKVFSRRRIWSKMPIVGKRIFTKWSIRPLERETKKIISEKTTLGSSAIKTGLCIVTKRADTFSTWPFINHPEGKFFEDNSEIPLWKLLRASSAAPAYFKPIELEIGVPTQPDYGVFVDGGVSMANNPALQLFYVTTLSGYPYRWPIGADKLLIVSVGTGFWKRRLARKELLHPHNLFWANTVPEMLMLDASDHTELMMQYLSQSATNRPIDFEIGDLSADVLGGKPAISYVRYNVELDTEETYKKHRDQPDPRILAILSEYNQESIEGLREMDNGKNANKLLELGDKFAAVEVKLEHLPKVFLAGIRVKDSGST